MMFRWRRKSRTASTSQQTKPKKKTGLPPVIFPELSEAIDDGILLALRIVRLDVKNAIIKRTVGEKVPFAAADYRDAANASLDRVLKELRHSAERVAGVRDRARPGRSLSAHDYRHADIETLSFRERASQAVSERIEADREDEAYVDGLIERARADAWTEISAHIERELLDPWSKDSPRMQLPSSPEDDPERGERFDDLEKELRKLAREAKIQERRDAKQRERS